MMERLERAFMATVTMYVLAVGAGVAIRDWKRERDRVARVVADTAAELNTRADAIRERVETMRASEAEARYDHTAWGEE